MAYWARTLPAIVTRGANERTQYDPSPATMRPCHQEVCSILRFQSSEAFQSSRTSWSSKIIAVGTHESNHRLAGSVQASW